MLDLFNAKPIWIADDTNEKNEYAEFKKSFNLSENRRTELYIFADTQYVCYVNNQFAACGQYSAVKNEKYYDRVDITEYVQRGINELLILVYYQGMSSAGCVSERPGLRFAIDTGDNSVFSDSTVMCRRDLRFESGEIEMVSPQILYTFHYNAGAECAAWENAAEVCFDNTALVERPVKKCVISERVDGEVIAQGYVLEGGNCDIAAHQIQTAYMSAREPSEVFKTDLFGPLRIDGGLTLHEHDNGTYIVFDLKKEMSGYFQMDIEADCGTVLNIAYGEHLDDLRVRAKAGNRNFAFSYVCAGGRQKFSYYVKRIAGRFLQLNINQCRNFKIYGFGIQSCDYPFIPKEKYRGDRLLEKIYDVSVNTLKLCFHEHYEDCPWREQAMYMMDSRLQMLCGYYTFQNTEAQIAALETFLKSGTADGRLPLTAPSDSADFTIPAFILMWVVALKDYLVNTGDRNGVGKMLEYGEKMLSLFEGMFDGVGIKVPSDSGYWSFYDWADGLDNAFWEDSAETKHKGYDAPIMLYYIMAVQSYIYIADCMEMDSCDLKRKEALMKKRVNELFWNEKSGLYRTYSDNDKHYCELVQALAVCTETAHNCDDLRKKLLNGECGVRATLSMLFFKYEALMGNVKYKDAVFSDIAQRWGKMLFKGATSFWETEEGGYAFANGGSMCHGWSAIPAYFLQKYKNM